MIEIIIGAVVYTATLIGCPTGDMCRVNFGDDTQITGKQTLQFADFTTPSLVSICQQERSMASTTAMVTSSYMRQVGKVWSTGEFDANGDLLVTAPQLKAHFLEYGYAREINDTRGWCND